MPENHRSLPLAEWPEADRAGWQAACRPALRLDPGGAAGAMRPVSQITHQRAHGQLLACLARAGRLVLSAPPAGNVSPENVDLFLQALEHRGIASVTCSNYLNRILRVATILAPDHDFAWLREHALLAARQAKPRPKAHRIHRADHVRREGLRLMDEAGGKVGTPLEKARHYRDGLMIALLFSVPIRLGNFAGLRLGETVRKIGTAWWLAFEDDEMKADRPDLREAPPLLQSYIDQWVDEWRPVFGQPGPAFWPSIKGGGLAYTYVGTLISRITSRQLGVAINPHLARDCAVYTIATAAGSQMGLASALLQHTDPRTTNRYYNTGARTLAMQNYQKLMDQLEGDVS